MTATQDNFQRFVLDARTTIAATLQDPYQAENAVLFLMDADGRVHELSRYKDVYDGLQETSRVALQDNHVAVGVFTTGWAAPFNGDQPPERAPSEHPNRVRVQLCTALDREFRSVSVIQMSDRDDTIVEGGGEGPLADALAAVMATMLRARAQRSVDA